MVFSTLFGSRTLIYHQYLHSFVIYNLGSMVSVMAKFTTQCKREVILKIVVLPLFLLVLVTKMSIFASICFTVVGLHWYPWLEFFLFLPLFFPLFCLVEGLIRFIYSKYLIQVDIGGHPPHPLNQHGSPSSHSCYDFLVYYWS
jgi:hypothetical protein